MRIHELEIDRFGVWNHVSLPLGDDGLTVFYGPNEAGKSTLLRFVRGVLYGFQPADEIEAGRRSARVQCAGTLKVSADGQTYRIRRVSQPGTRGKLEVNGRAIEQHDPLIQQLTGGASESLFQDVFAISLRELQQLSTLQGDEVAQLIYAVSLGRAGEQLMRAGSAMQTGIDRFISSESRKGEIPALLQELAEVDRELERIGQPVQRHVRLGDQIVKHETSVEQLKRKQSQLQHDLRGYQTLSRVWEPWNQHRQLREQLDQLPVTRLDAELLSRFDAMELELSEIDARRKKLIEEAKRLQKQAQDIKLRPELEEQACAIEHLQQQSSGMQQLEQQLREPRNTDAAEQQVIQPFVSRLEGHWNAQRVKSASLSPADIHELIQVGEAYKQANRSRTRTAKRYKRLASSLKQEEHGALDQKIGANGPSPEQQRAETRKRIEELESLRSLTIRKEHLQKTVDMLPEMQSIRPVEQQLPPLFYGVLWFFGISGVVLCLSGLYGAAHGLVVGGWHAAIIGACYSLLGLGALGTCWTLKQHFSRQQFRIADFDADRQRIEREISHLEAQIQGVKARSLLRPQRTAPGTGPGVLNDEQLIKQAIDELREELQQLSTTTDRTGRLERLREKMSGMRASLQEHQKRVSRARRDWTEALRRWGLPETLKMRDAIEQCQLIYDAHVALEEWRRTQLSEEQRRQQLTEFRERVQQLSHQIDGRSLSGRDPFQLISEWHRELQLLGERRRERSQLRLSSKEKRREASRLVEKIERMREQRALLLSQLGVSNRKEIASILASIDERAELEAQVRQAQQNLERMTRNEPDLALTEDLLLDYHPEENRQQIQRVEFELLEIDEALQAEYQTIGKLKSELQELEDDRRVAALRFDREQIANALREAGESLLAHRVAAEALERLREQLQRERQPQTLRAAGESLRQLTCQKYSSIWAPLGERRLMVDDDAGASLTIEQLSSGTREQVFLALRLAMIRDFADQGIELPMVLDDVTVNFDQIRTEAAVETLLNVVDRGQQVMLLTCHLHLAHLFEQEGVEPVWLPAHRAAMAG